MNHKKKIKLLRKRGRYKLTAFSESKGDNNSRSFILEF